MCPLVEENLNTHTKNRSHIPANTGEQRQSQQAGSSFFVTFDNVGLHMACRNSVVRAGKAA